MFHLMRGFKRARHMVSYGSLARSQARAERAVATDGEVLMAITQIDGEVLLGHPKPETQCCLDFSLLRWLGVGQMTAVS